MMLYCDGCGQPVSADEHRFMCYHVYSDHHPDCLINQRDDFCSRNCPILVQCGPVEQPQRKLI